MNGVPRSPQGSDCRSTRTVVASPRMPNFVGVRLLIPVMLLIGLSLHNPLHAQNEKGKASAEVPRTIESVDVTRGDNVGNRPRIYLREVLVPADDLDKWPAGDWQPISRQDFLSHWKLLQPLPQQPQKLWIGRAEYSAVLVDDHLQFGHGSLSINSREKSPVLLPLSPIELPLSNFKLNDQPAVWGNSPDGGVMLLIAEKTSTAEFEWNLKGNRRRHSVVFDVEVPSATATILQLNLPDHMRLESSRGVVSGPVAATEEGWSRWTIDLGQESACQLTVREQSPKETKNPEWMIQQETLYHVRQEGVEIQADLNVVLDGDAVQQIQIPVPPGVEVYSVAYGNDSKIPWTVSQDAETKQSLLTLELPDPIKGAFRPIRLNCFADTLVDQDWSLPLFRIPGVLVQGNLRLTIESPLQLNNVLANGCRIVNASSGISTGATYQLVQDERDADVKIRVAFPAVDVTGKLLNHLLYDSPGWTWIAELSLSSQSGAAYQIQSLLPTRWDVIEVQLSEASAQKGQILKWVVEPADEEHQRLILDMARAIDPEHALSVAIRSRQTPGIVEEKLNLPVLQPVKYQLKESLFAVASPGQEMPHIQLGPGMQSVSAASLNSAWSYSKLFQSLRDSPQPKFWFLSSSTARDSFLEFPQFRQGLTGRTTVEYDMFLDRLEERYFVVAEPVSEPIDRVMVYSTGTGPEFEWEQLTDRAIHVEAERLSTDRHQNWNLPAKGELWEIRLPKPSQEPIRLRAQRVRYHAGQITGQLVFLPQTREFSGTIELNGSPDMNVMVQTSAYALQTQEKDLPNQQSNLPVTIRRWEYDDLSDQFEMQINTESAEHQPSPMMHLKLHSQLFADGTGQNIHRARFYFSENFRSTDFTYQLPPHVEWIATKVNGLEVQPQFRGTNHVIAVVAASAASNARRSNQVEVEYREPSEAVWLRERREIPLPQVDFPIVQFDWDLELPAGFSLDSIPRGLNGVSDDLSLDWHARWFGPLGRASNAGWFNPFDISVWRDLYHRLRRSIDGSASDISQNSRQMWNRSQLQGRSVQGSISIVLWNGNRLDWISWLAFFSTMAIGGWIKISSPRLLTGIGGTAWWTVLLVSIWFVEGPASVVVGAMALGSFFAFFSPTTWFMRRSLVLQTSAEWTATTTHQLPSGTSGVTPLRGSVSLLIVLVLSMGWKAVAQNSQPTQVPESNASRTSTSDPDEDAESETEGETWDVLVPYDERGEKNQPAEFVYVQTQTARRMRELTAPLNAQDVGYLISSAEYVADWDENDRVKLTAKFKLVVFSGRKNRSIFLPIEHAHLAREATCTVDGRAETILMVPNRSGFLIEMPSSLSAPPPPLPEEPAGGESTIIGREIAASINRDEIHFHDIALSLYPAVKTTEGSLHFEMQIPPVNDSRLLLRFPQLPADVEVNGDRAIGVAKFESSDYRVSLGRQSLMSVKWSRELPVPETTVVSALQHSLLEFSPALVRGRSQVRYQIQTGFLQDIRWKLPQGAIVRSVKSDRLSSHEIVTSNDGNRHLLVEFDERQTGELRVVVEWWFPVAEQDDSRIEIPPVNWFAHSFDAQTLIEVEEVQVGMSSVPGYEIVSAVAPQNVLRQISTDEFQAAWTNATESRRPAFVAAYKPETAIACALTPHRGVKKVRQDEVLHFTRQRAAWSAAIEVETTLAPAMSHELILDSRIQLENVSIKQDDAERLSHFIREGDRLTLILKDLTSATQNIVLQGSWPVEIERKQTLPRFACQADEISRSTIAIRYDDALKVELSPGEQWKEFPAEPDVAPADAAWKSLGRFVRQSAGQDYQISFQTPGNAKLSSLATLKLKSGKTWSMRIVFHVEQVRGLNAPLIVEIPHEIENSRMQSSSVWNVREEQNSLGKRIYSCTLVMPEKENDVIVIEGEWNMSGDGPWTVPLPAVENSEIEKQALMISPRDLFRPEAAEERQIPEDIPPWGRIGTEEFAAAKASRLYVKGQGVWTLTPAVAREQQTKLNVHWMRSECRINRSSGWLGRTLICVESAPGLVLRIDWPQTSRLDAVWLNGATLPVGVSQLGEVSVPLGSLNSSGSLQVVQIYWQQPVDASWKVVWNSSLLLPQIHEAEETRHFVEIIGSGRQRRLSLAGLAPLDEFEFHLELAESYAERIQQVEETHPGVELLRNDLFREMRFLSSSREQAERAAGMERLLPRWIQLTNSVDEGTDGIESDATWISTDRMTTESLSDRLGQNQIVLGIWPQEPLPTKSSTLTASPVIQLWWIDSRWYTGIAAALSLCVIWYVLRRLFIWLNRRELGLHASGFALGVSLIWWFCLRASFFGFCLMIFSLWILWKQWRRSRLAVITGGASIAR